MKYQNLTRNLDPCQCKYVYHFYMDPLRSFTRWMMVRCFFPQWKEQQKPPGTADEWTSCGGFNDFWKRKSKKKEWGERCAKKWCFFFCGEVRITITTNYRHLGVKTKWPFPKKNGTSKQSSILRDLKNMPKNRFIHSIDRVLADWQGSYMFRMDNFESSNHQKRI